MIDFEETAPKADNIVDLLRMVEVADTQYGSMWVYDAAQTGADEIERLRKRLKWLDCLEAAGVDNWEGIDYAHELKGDHDD